MRKILLISLLAFGLFGAECSPLMKLATNNAKSEMAQMEDEYTKATEISCKDEIITYKYLLKNTDDLKWETLAGETKAEIINELKTAWTEDLCGDPDAFALLKTSSGFAIDYYLVDGSLFTSIKTTAQNCKK